MTTTPLHPEVTVQLTGQNGNAFVLLGLCVAAARKAGVSNTEVNEFRAEATAGGYDELLTTCMKWFDVS